MPLQKYLFTRISRRTTSGGKKFRSQGWRYRKSKDDVHSFDIDAWKYSYSFRSFCIFFTSLLVGVGRDSFRSWNILRVGSFSTNANGMRRSCSRFSFVFRCFRCISSTGVGTIYREKEIGVENCCLFDELSKNFIRVAIRFYSHRKVSFLSLSLTNVACNIFLKNSLIKWRTFFSCNWKYIRDQIGVGSISGKAFWEKWGCSEGVLHIYIDYAPHSHVNAYPGKFKLTCFLSFLLFSYVLYFIIFNNWKSYFVSKSLLI